jgi:hypothetical protein
MKMIILSLMLGGIFVPSAANAQSSPDGGVTMVLVTWLQSKEGQTTAPNQLVIGNFNDDDSCIKAAQKTRLSSGGTPVVYNVVCIPRK